MRKLPCGIYDDLTLMRALVDDDDYEKTCRYIWRTRVRNSRIRYVFTDIRKDNEPGFIPLTLHHMVIGKPPNGLVVDHINRDPLDNRKVNLRFVTPKENSANKE